MRVLVIGPYPPSADAAADTVLAGVRSLRDAHAIVTVVSPTPSAAPTTGDPTTWAGAMRVARVVRSADRVVWYAPSTARAAFPLRRALAAVPVVERRDIPSPADVPRRGLVRWWRRARAGAPTLLRSVARR